jgi:hypothetical protein
MRVRMNALAGENVNTLGVANKQVAEVVKRRSATRRASRLSSGNAPAADPFEAASAPAPSLVSPTGGAAPAPPPVVALLTQLHAAPTDTAEEEAIQAEGTVEASDGASTAAHRDDPEVAMRAMLAVARRPTATSEDGVFDAGDDRKMEDMLRRARRDSLDSEEDTYGIGKVTMGAVLHDDRRDDTYSRHHAGFFASMSGIAVPPAPAGLGGLAPVQAPKRHSAAAAAAAPALARAAVASVKGEEERPPAATDPPAEADPWS